MSLRSVLARSLAKGLFLFAVVAVYLAYRELLMFHPALFGV